MTTVSNYTSLESYLLARNLAHYGVEAAGLAKVAEILQTHPFVVSDPAHDASRLTPEALLEHFRTLIADAWCDPTKRVKGQSPPMPSLEDVQSNFEERYDELLQFLYSRLSQDVLSEVRDHERGLQQLARDIRELEEAEKAERLRAEAQQPPGRKMTPAAEAQQAKLAEGRGRSPGQIPGKPSPPLAPAQQQTQPLRNNSLPTPGTVQPPAVVSPAQGPATVPLAAKPHQPGKPQVLQPPMGAGQPPRGIQSTSPVPLPAISPRPESAKPKTPGPAPQQQPAPPPGTLKWEKPYQPPVPAAQGRPVPTQAPLVANGPGPAASPGPQPGQPQQAAQWAPAPAQQAHVPQQMPLQQAAGAPRQQPVLMAPQPAGQVLPPGQGRGVSQPPQGKQASTTPVPAPIVPSSRPGAPPQGQQPPIYQHRPIAAAEPTHSPVPLQPAGIPPQRWPQQQAQGQPPQYTPSTFSPTPPPANIAVKPTPDPQRRVGSPYANQPPRPALPPHIASQVPGSPSPVQRTSSAFAPPKTPVSATPTFRRTGSGTKWTAASTASTPNARPTLGDFPSPAFEPLSPVLQTTKLPVPAKQQPAKKSSPKPEVSEKATPSKDAKPGRGRGRPPRLSHKDGADGTPSRSGPSRRSQSLVSQADELSMEDPDLAQRIKNEESTPRPPQDEAGDTTADESLPGRRQRFTPGSVSSRPTQKRKRQETPTEPLPPASTPTHVLWTRQFSKISNPALDQISSHRCANQFAHPIRERDAPGYRGLILQPQDIKSIRAAMTHGNRAAVEAAKALPGGDPGTPTVWLPINEDLLPPKSVINSEQLERELVHMFSNAIMYNLDPYRGPGKSFMRRDGSGDDDEAEPSTYLVDEDAVVRDSRIMFMEVERLLGDLRTTERERSGLPPSASGSARPGSVAATPAGEATPATPGVDDDADELAGEDGAVATVKRRRIGTRA